jgi:hypothetical protein
LTHRTKSGWHGWVYGWKFHLTITVAAIWSPLAAELTPANAADNETAPRRLEAVPQVVRLVLGDTNYQDPALGAVLVYQLTLLWRFEHRQDLRVRLKAFLKAA